MWLGFLPQRRSKSSKQSTMCKRECRQWRQTTREASENRLGENWMCKRKESLTFFPPIYFLMSSKLFPTRLNWMSSLSSRAHSRFIVMFSHPFYAMFIPVAFLFFCLKAAQWNALRFSRLVGKLCHVWHQLELWLASTVFPHCCWNVERDLSFLLPSAEAIQDNGELLDQASFTIIITMEQLFLWYVFRSPFYIEMSPFAFCALWNCELNHNKIILICFPASTIKIASGRLCFSHVFMQLLFSLSSWMPREWSLFDWNFIHFHPTNFSHRFKQSSSPSRWDGMGVEII